MILGFKKQFEQKIIEGSKIHTIREDPHDRWKPGKEIHFATGVRTKNYNEFRKGVCISVQRIKIFRLGGEAIIHIGDNITLFRPLFRQWPEQMRVFVKNDGFDSVEDFLKWFNKDFDGKIIHWTSFRY